VLDKLEELELEVAAAPAADVADEVALDPYRPESIDNGVDELYPYPPASVEDGKDELYPYKPVSVEDGEDELKFDML
jgi:hypothetical protein